MARDFAVISRIQDIKPIDGKDRIEVVTIENYDVIAKKGEFNIGDLAVYIGEETVLPVKPEFEFLRSRCFSPSQNGFRIRPMKMGGVISIGIVFPTSILPKDCAVTEGKVVTDIIGVWKYEPPESTVPIPQKKGITKYLMRYSWYRKLVCNKLENKRKFPKNVAKTDEDNIQKIYENGYHHLTQNIKDVAQIAPKQFEHGINKMLEKSQLDVATVKCFFANIPTKHLMDLTIESLRKDWGREDLPFYTKLSTRGYQGAPSILVALDDYLMDNDVLPDERLVSFVAESSKWMHAGFILNTHG